MKLAFVYQKAQKSLVLGSYKLYMNNSKGISIPKTEEISSINIASL